MHVAILTGSLACGGAERVIVNLIEYLINEGDQVTLVTQFEYEEEYPLPKGAVRLISGLSDEEMTKSRVVNFDKRFMKLRNIWKSEKPDVILSFIGKNNIMALWTSRGLKIPVAVSVRSLPSREYYNSWMKFMAKTYFAKADALILQTHQQLEYFPKRVQNKAIIMKNPINPVFMAEPYMGERDKSIIAVGRVDDNKNHKLLIDAFMNIADDYPEWKVVIYGDGVSRNKLISYVKDKGFEDRISLPGRENNIFARMQKTGIFVLTSNAEGSPNALIEAMCQGIPVISTDCPCGGPAELIRNGENGLLIPVGDVIKMQDNLQELMNDLQKRNNMGSAALATRDIYNSETVLKEWRELLINLANKGKSK